MAFIDGEISKRGRGLFEGTTVFDGVLGVITELICVRGKQVN
jgi:hypothetical protein